jgi:UDP-galactopyranose mutase|tara:strand:+ start:143 stop:1285 length:1143 start_codon:yes stop_codon:yes gene_type:complete
MQQEYDYLIVGAGLFGATFAREMTDAGYKCLVIDKREHIGGNVYSEKRNGIDVHVYGAHIFHTNNDGIWNYVNRFATFNNYINKPKVRFGDKIFSFPINLMTLHQLWGVTSPAEAEAKLKEVRIPCENPDNLEDWILSQVGREVYETFIKGYTMKQWQRDPKELPASIIKRLPIRMVFEENYFFDKYQGIPVEGYTAMVDNMLDGITVKTGIDYFADKEHWNGLANKIIFSGKIDEYFDFRFGELEYRTLRFEHEELEGDFQGNAVINYTHPDTPFTRILEHKHFQPQTAGKINNTIITREYSDEYKRGKTPYYPINDDKNTKMYKKYEHLAKNEGGVIFGGRLSEYKYYDMHQVIGSALVKAKRELENQAEIGYNSLTD